MYVLLDEESNTLHYSGVYETAEDAAAMADRFYARQGITYSVFHLIAPAKPQAAKSAPAKKAPAKKAAVKAGKNPATTTTPTYSKRK